MAATQDGVAVSAGDGIAFYSQDGKRLWASKRGGSPVAAYGTHVFISGDRGIDVARIQNGDTISKIGDCAKDDISWLIASQYGLLTGCAEPSTGDIALIAAHTDGSILGRSTFKGGLVDGPQWKPVNANAVWLYGVSSGATLSYRSALVDLANASVVGRPQSMWPAGFDGGYAFAASWNGPAPYQLALARINATSGRVSYEYYRLPEFSSEVNSPQIYVHGGYVYAASAHVLYRYKVSGSGDVLDTRLASNRLANTPRFADGYALVEKEQSHAVLALQLDTLHETELGHWSLPAWLPFSGERSGLIAWVGANGIDVFHNGTVTTISGMPCQPAYAAVSRSRWYFMCEGPSQPRRSYTLYAVAP